MGALSDVERIAFENEVKHQYQAIGSALENTVRVKDAPQPGVYKFRKFGKIEMVPRGAYKSALEAVQTSHTVVPCTAADFVLPVMTDVFEQSHTGGEAPMEQREAAIAIAHAMKRRRDYSVIEALEAANDASEITQTVTASSGLTVAKLAEALKYFDKKEMRAGGDPIGGGVIYTLITEEEHHDLLTDSVTQSIETSNFKSLVDGKVGDIAGHKLILIGTGRGDLGLGKTSTTRRCYSYVKSAMGQSVSMAPRVESEYQMIYQSELTVGKLSLGSCVVDVEGVVRLDVTE